jgi:hypothetical protein
MNKTRADLKAQKDAFLINNSGNAITPEQFNTLFEDLLDSVFLPEDDYTYPASVETINVTSATFGVQVNEVKVVGERQPLIDTPAMDAADGLQANLNKIRDKLREVVVAMENHGLIAPNA